MLMLGDDIRRANFADVVNRQQEDRAEAAFLIEKVPSEGASRYGACDTSDYWEVVEIMEKPEAPDKSRSDRVLHRFSTIFHACHLVPPSDCEEYELPDAIDLLIQSGHTIETVRMDGGEST